MAIVRIICNCVSVGTIKVTTRNINYRFTVRITTSLNDNSISGSYTTTSSVNKIHFLCLTLNIATSNIDNTALTINCSCTGNVTTGNIQCTSRNINCNILFRNQSATFYIHYGITRIVLITFCTAIGTKNASYSRGECTTFNGRFSRLRNINYIPIV